MVSFTGSTRAGKRVSELAAATVKRVALELGGKSPNIILDDADFEQAVTDGVGKAFLNSGQTCSALTRMIVPRSKLAEVEEIAGAAAETYTLGDPFGADTRLGPLVSKAQHDRVRGYIEKGIEEGAKLVTGGAEQPEGLPTGFFVKPTVFSDVAHDMTIAQEEIFGPVLSIIPYDTRTRRSRSPTTRSTAWPAACGPATPSGPRRSPAGSAPARSRSTAAASTRSRRSAATSSPATAASSASSASTSSSRPSRSSCSDRLDVNGRQRIVVVVAVGSALAVIALVVDVRWRSVNGGWMAYTGDSVQTDTYYVEGRGSDLLKTIAVWLTAIALWAGFSVWLLPRPSLTLAAWWWPEPASG